MPDSDTEEYTGIARLCRKYGIPTGALDITGSTGTVTIHDNTAFERFYVGEAPRVPRERENVQQDGRNRTRVSFPFRGWTFETYVSERVTRARRR